MPGVEALGDLALASIAPIGTPPPSALASVMMSGLTPSVLVREERAGAAHAGLDLVEDEQQFVPVAQVAHALEIVDASA